MSTLAVPVSVKRSSSQRSPPRAKRGADVRRTNSFNLLARPSKPGDRLNVELLYSLTPYKENLDEVSEYARSILINAIKMEPHVHDIFFPNENQDPVLDYLDTRGFPMDKLATALVAESISKIKDEYKFHQMIDKTSLQDVLRDIYNGLQWKKLGFCLYSLTYPDVVRDQKTGVCLRDFIDDNGHVWAEKLLAHIMEPRWTLMWMFRIVRGQCTEADYNREMNALFVKIHLLDPQVVIPAFQFLLNQKALPSVNLELATRNYLGGSLDSSLLDEEVMAAEHKDSVPLNASRISLSDLEVTHGVEVEEFITSECRTLDIWNEKRPENSKLSKARDRCVVM